MKLNILSGGAAYGLMAAITPEFEKQHQCTVEGEYGAVGLMKEKLLQGEPCDVLILSRKLIDALIAQNRVHAQSVANVGIVSTGVGVKQGSDSVDISSSDAFRQALLQCNGIFVPHMTQSTAGIHMKSVFERLGIFGQIQSKCHEFPNGATAMKAMVDDPNTNLIGCTQETEILSTSGARLVGALPAGCELDTIYTAAVSTGANEPELASKLVTMLQSPALQELKARKGFKPLP
jgi:molybdate transport system substrate-binding protein